MKKFITVIACLLFIFTVRVNANSSQALENLTVYEKSNAVIYIECEETAEEKANLIEETWNNGDYEEAIALLKNSTELEDVTIVIEWKEPERTSQRWGGDVRVGVNDSITHTALDVDNSTGNLFAVLRYDESATGNHVAKGYISSDTGRTWVSRFGLSAPSTSPIFDIDVAVLGDYFYFAYSISSASNNVRICRFNTSDGFYDSDYGQVIVINEGPVIRELSLTSSIDHLTLSLAEPSSNQFLFCYAIMDNDSLRYYYSDTAATIWNQFPYPNTGNVDRGLDACYTEPGGNWVSYIGTNDSLYVMKKEMSWVNYGPLAYIGPNSAYVTSIGAYGDTVIVVYPFVTAGPSYYVRYHITYDGGTGWYVGTIYSSSSDLSFVNDVTARNGDGIGVFYQTTGYAAEGIYRHRGYYSSWATSESIADYVPRQDVKPSIERIADGIYGILYVNSPEEMAWFDRSDWIEGGIEVPDENTASILKSTQSIASKQIDINYYLPAGQTDMSLDIFDVTGKHIKNLAKGMPGGSHSVTWFGDSKGKPAPSGIYFAVLKYGELKESLKIALIR
jgi:hypothetical protein